MATPAAGMGLTAAQQGIVNKAVTNAVSGVGAGESNATIQANFANYLGSAANNAPGVTTAPSGLDFTTGAAPNPSFMGGATATTQMIDAAFNTVSNNGHNSSFHEQGSPAVFAASWIAQLDALFSPASTAAPAPAPAAAPIATPIAAAPTPLPGTSTAGGTPNGNPNQYTAPSNPTAAPIGAGTPAMSAPNPSPAITGDPTTTSATTATTGQNLASADPSTALGALIAAMTNSTANTAGATGGVSIPPSAILPTDTSGGFSGTSGTSGGISTPTSTASAPAASSTSMTDMIVIGVIASLIAAAIWYFAIKHGSLKGLEKELHV